MAKETQFNILLDVLRSFHREGILNNVMLVGSWCLYFYRNDLKNAGRIPAVRTMDVDFLVSNWRKIDTETDVPALLRKLGFAPTFNRSNDLTVYDHPELRVEFLIPELGKGQQKPRTVSKLHIKAQALRYLDFLAGYPKSIRYEDMTILVPEPAVFAIHKLMISGRRKKEEKRSRDLEAAVGVLDTLLSSSRETARIQTILGEMPGPWLKKLRPIAEKEFPSMALMIPV